MKSKIIYYGGRVDIPLYFAGAFMCLLAVGLWPFEKRLFPGISMYDLLTIATTEAILCMLILVRVHEIIWSFLIDEEKIILNLPTWRYGLIGLAIGGSWFMLVFLASRKVEIGISVCMVVIFIYAFLLLWALFSLIRKKTQIVLPLKDMQMRIIQDLHYVFIMIEMNYGSVYIINGQFLSERYATRAVKGILEIDESIEIKDLKDKYSYFLKDFAFPNLSIFPPLKGRRL